MQSDLSVWIEASLPHQASGTTPEHELVCENLALVPFAAKRRRRAHTISEDDLQDGAIGLLNAAKSFDPARGKFSTYATWAIGNAICRQKRKSEQLAESHTLGVDFSRNLAPREDEREHPDDVRLLLKRAFRKMTPRQRRMVKAHYLEGLTYREIGEREGVCKERVRQIILAGLEAGRGKRK